MNKPKKTRLSGLVKKTIMSSLGALFITEESVRKLLTDMKLPKSVIISAVSQAEKTKKEIMQLIALEVRNFLETMEADKLVKKIVSGSSIEIKASIKLVDNSQNKKDN